MFLLVFVYIVCVYVCSLVPSFLTLVLRAVCLLSRFELNAGRLAAPACLLFSYVCYSAALGCWILRIGSPEHLQGGGNIPRRRSY